MGIGRQTRLRKVKNTNKIQLFHFSNSPFSNNTKHMDTDAVTENLILKENVFVAAEKLRGIIKQTPLEKNTYYSQKYNASICFKREDLQVVRSYKIRGAYNKISSLPKEQLINGVVCASAGNHAQGVALSCQLLQTKGHIFMPVTTPKQKVNRVELLGKGFIEIILTGDTFDECNLQALEFAQSQNVPYISPFNDQKVIEGQATVGAEILNELNKIDYIFVPIGGGGIASGIISLFKELSPETKIIGVEPQGAPAMYESIKESKIKKLSKIDKFVDGAAVQQVGDITYSICKEGLDDMILIPEGKVCTTLLELYNQEAIVAEPAGALSVAALDYYKDKIEGKNIVCIISGGNNDVMRMEEIKERSLLYEGLKHYFMVIFPQRPGALKEFVNDVLGPDDNIVLFEYSKKTNRESGPALVGIELKNKKDLSPLTKRMKKLKFFGEYVNNNKLLFEYLV